MLSATLPDDPNEPALAFRGLTGGTGGWGRGVGRGNVPLDAEEDVVDDGGADGATTMVVAVSSSDSLLLLLLSM